MSLSLLSIDKGHAFISGDGGKLYVSEGDGPITEIPLVKPVPEGTILKSDTNPHLVIVYSLNGLLISVNLERKTSAIVLSPEQVVRDRIAWCGWHPCSASGDHLCILTSNGLFLLIRTTSGNIELRLRVRSPEDFSLLCTTAAVYDTVLWVGMENGDLLAVSPILPFPCKSEGLFPSELEEHDEEIRFYADLEAESQNGIIRRTLPILKVMREPRIQGPLLLQPEPMDDSPPLVLHPFRYNGIDFIAIFSSSGHLHIYMLHSSIRPQWRDSNDRCILTLIETVLLPFSKPLSVNFVHPSSLLVVMQDKIILIDLMWLPQLLTEPLEACETLEALRSSQVSRLPLASDNDPKIVNSKIEANAVVVLTEDRSITRIIIPMKADPKFVSCLMSEGSSMSIKSVKSKLYSNAPSLPKMTLPKLTLPQNIKSARFPEEIDEDALEKLLGVVHEWRTKTLFNCSTLVEEMKRRMSLMRELARKQDEWATLLINHGNTILNIFEKSNVRINELESTLNSLPNLVGATFIDQKYIEELQKVHCRLLNMADSLQNNNVAESTPGLLDSLQSQAKILDHIQDKLHRIRVGSEEGGIVVGLEVGGCD